MATKQPPIDMERDPELDEIAGVGADTTRFNAADAPSVLGSGSATIPPPQRSASPYVMLAKMHTQTGELPIYQRGRSSARDAVTNRFVAELRQQPQCMVFLKPDVNGKDTLEEVCINGVCIALWTSRMYFVPESFYLHLLNIGKTMPLQDRYERDLLQMDVPDPRETAARGDERQKYYRDL